ncbi:MAG: hypothetical protein M3O46_00515 [Myxococcota bacterium]|nr:hypothetical protein [Myxococcota bacterium]
MRHPRRRLASSLGVFALAASATQSSQSLAAEPASKEVCLAAADTGQSLRDDGQYLGAREQFIACGREVCPKLVHDQCAEWLRHIDEAIPTVVFGAKDDRGQQVVDARVLLDGKLLMATLDGKATPLNPGPHDIRFEREPNSVVNVHVVLRAGEKNREVSATFPAVDEQVQAPPAPQESGIAPPPVAEEHQEQKPSQPLWSPHTVTSASLLAAGAVAVGFGVFFGLQSQSENSHAATLRMPLGTGGCLRTATNACQQLNDTVDAQNRDATVSAALYVTGGVLAAAAVATWFLWPKGESHANTTWVTPMVGPEHAGIGFGGAF